MGDWFEIVVDPLVEAGDAPALADHVIEELIAAGLVKPERTDCALGGLGYPPAPGVLGYLKTPDAHLMQLQTNGVAVTTRRCVHVNVDVKRVLCPGCGAATDDLSGLAWPDAVGEWYEGGQGALSCPACLQETSVAAWTHERTCGFGNLAFTLWNWPPFEAADQDARSVH